MERYNFRPSQTVASSTGMEIHFKRQAAVSPAATHDQNPYERDERWKNAMRVWTTKISTAKEPLTARINARP